MTIKLILFNCVDDNEPPYKFAFKYATAAADNWPDGAGAGDGDGDGDGVGDEPHNVRTIERDGNIK